MLVVFSLGSRLIFSCNHPSLGLLNDLVLVNSELIVSSLKMMRLNSRKLRIVLVMMVELGSVWVVESKTGPTCSGLLRVSSLSFEIVVVVIELTRKLMMQRACYHYH